MPYLESVPYGLVARIPGFHPGGSGSIPGMGMCLLLTPKRYLVNRFKVGPYYIVVGYKFHVQ